MCWYTPCLYALPHEQFQFHLFVQRWWQEQGGGCETCAPEQNTIKIKKWEQKKKKKRRGKKKNLVKT
jgi:hypothetical protein